MSSEPSEDNERCLTDAKTRDILVGYFAERRVIFETLSEELQQELIKGYQVELEHGKAMDPRLNVTDDSTDATIRIAMVHLKEIPDYYTRLAVLERDGKEAWVDRRAHRDRELHFVVATIGYFSRAK